MSKNYIYVIIAAIVVVVVLLVYKGNHSDQEALTSTSPTISASSTPGVIASEGPSSSVTNSHDAAVAIYNTRGLGLAADCMSSNPSHLEIANKTKIMIDNFASNQPRTIRIGDRSYSIAAHGWYITEISSAKLPATIPFFCGQMELGQIVVR